jgi:hypothetical protein
MLCGNPTVLDKNIVTGCGFEVTENLKLLGINIRANLDNVAEIFEGILTKIVNQAAYWERFKLSIPGRITIAKTFLVSQLNYVGCFLSPLLNY